MLSSVAEVVYWSSRYVERAENVARFIDVNLHLTLDSPANRGPSWEPLVMITGDHKYFFKKYETADANSVIQFLAFDTEYNGSIISSLRQARENVRMVQHVLSREMWQHLNDLYLRVKTEADAEHPSPAETSTFFDSIKLAGIHYEGLANATLSRGESWHFGRLGRMLERADKTSRILDAKYFILLPQVRDVGTTLDQIGWTALLNSASALQMYRQLHHVTTPDKVAEFLILDRQFPRSIRFCIAEAQKSLHEITGSPLGTFENDSEQALGRLRSTLDYADIEAIMEGGLHEYLDGLQGNLNEIGEAVHRQFFEIQD